MPARLAFDLETTELDTDKARIIEFCFLEVDDALQERSRWTELVHPGIPIPESSRAVHGIGDEMVRVKPPFSHFAPRIQALVQESVLIAHNVQFDLQVLHNELRRAGQPGLRPNHPAIDTQMVERFVNSHSLAACFERYTGKPMEGNHRSEADTAACLEVLRRQRQAHAALLPPSLEGLESPNLVKHFRPDAQAKTWLDHGHRFYLDAAGTIRFGFGKYRDQPALEQKDYLGWMRDKGDFPPDVKTMVVQWIGPPPGARPPPSRPPA
ncbi:MAG TPA: 3'-5' exonuclease [Candidatus Thermoplasmatota archaeon]|nr:3'-5' exonuclease [Candidatus Thermoplasmatota archaeon]